MIDREHPLLLGSASPRRREILATLGIPLTVRPAIVDERLDRLELAVVEIRVIAADERAQHLEGLGAGVGGRCHAIHPASCRGHRRCAARRRSGSRAASRWRCSRSFCR